MLKKIVLLAATAVTSFSANAGTISSAGSPPQPLPDLISCQSKTISGERFEIVKGTTEDGISIVRVGRFSGSKLSSTNEYEIENTQSLNSNDMRFVFSDGAFDKLSSMRSKNNLARYMGYLTTKGDDQNVGLGLVLWCQTSLKFIR